MFPILYLFPVSISGTVRFRNDHVAAIMGYQDYQIRNAMISKVYYVEALGYNLLSVGKSKKHTYKPKSEDSMQDKLYLLHMDLCSPMRIESTNGKKYILVIVNDYSRFTWVKFLRLKDETLEFKMKAYYEDVGFSHQTSVARTSQQNGVIERWNQTLVEAAA
ncbi:retrovirus-related pol polyprotein from transposon TNT 1-94 [Tanacetum coccineum]